MDIRLINTDKAPKALGNYSHAVGYGDLIFVSGIASRNPVTNEIPKGIEAETRATLENIRVILEAAGSGMNHVLEINVFLTNMNDFAAYNEVYAEFFSEHKPARTTIGVAALPGKISIEMKCVAVKR